MSTHEAVPLRELLAAGRLPRRLSAPDAAATLWCGDALEGLVPGAPAAREAVPVRPPASALPADLERALLAAGDAPVLLDGSLGARALTGLRRAAGRRPDAVAVRWGAPGAEAPEGGALNAKTLDATTLDAGAVFDAYAAAAEPPTVAGFEVALLEALVERAGLTAAVSAQGGDALFAAGDDARRACRRPRPRFLRRRFRPVEDPLDADAARRAEVAGLEGAPIHRVAALRAVLATQTRDALAGFGPRAVPKGLPRDGHLPSIWAATAALGDPGPDAATIAPARDARVRRPFALPAVRALVDALPRDVRFARPGSGGLLARWAAGVASAGRSPFDGFLDVACRGALASRLAAAFETGARTPPFRPDALGTALARFRAGTHGWSGRRVLTVAFLAAYVARERLTDAGA